MLLRFFHNKSGGFAIIAAGVLLVLILFIGVAIDYSNMIRHKNEVQFALDASSIAAAQYSKENILKLNNSEKIKEISDYARYFFDKQLQSVLPENVKLKTNIPSSSSPTLKQIATLFYIPFYQSVFELFGLTTKYFQFDLIAEVRLEITVEVAFVFDNSLSMDLFSSKVKQKRIDLLKEAANQFVDIIYAAGLNTAYTKDPNRIAIVPFSTFVNVGAGNQSRSWMDREGISPKHHSVFNWPVTLGEDRRVVQGANGIYRKLGSGWPYWEWSKVVTDSTIILGKDKMVEKEGYVYRKVGSGWPAFERGTIAKEFTIPPEEEKKIEKKGDFYKKVGLGWPASERDTIVTRFSMMKDMKYTKLPLPSKDSNSFKQFSWKGCVEARPYPYNISDITPSRNNPITLFVPSFHPDYDFSHIQPKTMRTFLDYWPGSFQNSAKYFLPKGGVRDNEEDFGPNYDCLDASIKPLTDISNPRGRESIKEAIAGMKPGGMTNMIEGLAWGWRVLSENEPFNQGRSYKMIGNQKIIIFLTDGENTYNYAVQSIPEYGAYGRFYYDDFNLSNISENSFYKGLLLRRQNGIKDFIENVKTPRDEMDNQLYHLCNTIKQKNIKIMTVGLDVNDLNNLRLLEECASSTETVNEKGPKKQKKLFWNSKGESLKGDFKEIAKGISDLRLIQ